MSSARHWEGVRNLSVNIYRHHDSLCDCKYDKDVHHSVFTRSDLYLGAELVLEHIAHILCSYHSKSVVESIGSVLENKREVRGESRNYDPRVKSSPRCHFIRSSKSFCQ